MASRRCRTISRLISSILLAMLFFGCAAPETALTPNTPAPSPSPAPSAAVPTPAPAAQALPLSVWAVYWDTGDVNDELSLLAPELGSVSVFSALFHPDDTPYLPDDTAALLASIQERFGAAKDIYLTFVNDLALTEGGFSLKDAALLERLFESGASMDAHIARMLALAKSAGCDGIELDYEGVRNKPALWKSYAAFIERLYRAAKDAGLLCRVVLEPSALGKAAYPKGPEYVLMCYNLYGSHSGPGPKADPEFIASLAREGRDLGDLSFAFSTGGFDWDANGEAAQLTEREAAALARAHGAAPERDAKSGALRFAYAAGDGTRHTVWYADGETLALWMRAAAEEGGSRFAVWRAGGNAEASLRAVAAAARERK